MNQICLAEFIEEYLVTICAKLFFSSDEWFAIEVYIYGTSATPPAGHVFEGSNGISHFYQLDQSLSVKSVVGWNFSF